MLILDKAQWENTLGTSLENTFTGTYKASEIEAVFRTHGEECESQRVNNVGEDLERIRRSSNRKEGLVGVGCGSINGGWEVSRRRRMSSQISLLLVHFISEFNLHLVLSVNFFQIHLLHLVFFWTNMLTFFLVIIFMSFWHSIYH